MYKFRALLTKEQIFTIPNFMSFFRLALIPFIIWDYLQKEYLIAAALMLVSAATDVFDGVIARRFNMVSELGKVLDPIADKLTHGALMVCILTVYTELWPLFVLLAFKEFTMFFVGSLAVRRGGKMQSAQWYGKLCTVVLEAIMIFLLLTPLIPDFPVNVVYILGGVCAGMMVFSLVMYSIYWTGVIRGAGKTEQEAREEP